MHRAWWHLRCQSGTTGTGHVKRAKPTNCRPCLLGVIDLGDHTVEPPDVVAERIRRALPYVPAEDIIVAPDCGMKYLPREAAFGKMRAMADGARVLREEAGAGPVATAPSATG